MTQAAVAASFTSANCSSAPCVLLERFQCNDLITDSLRFLLGVSKSSQGLGCLGCFAIASVSLWIIWRGGLLLGPETWK